VWCQVEVLTTPEEFDISIPDTDDTTYTSAISEGGYVLIYTVVILFVLYNLSKPLWWVIQRAKHWKQKLKGYRITNVNTDL